MKKFLFLTLPSVSHFCLLAPIAKELIKKGNNVVFSSSPSIESLVTDNGFEFYKSGFSWHESSLHKIISNFENLTTQKKYLKIQQLFWDDYPKSTLFELTGLIDNFNPDYIISSSYEISGYFLSIKFGIKHIIISNDIRVDDYTNNSIFKPFLLKFLNQFNLNLSNKYNTRLILCFMPEDFKFLHRKKKHNEHYFQPIFYNLGYRDIPILNTSLLNNYEKKIFISFGSVVKINHTLEKVFQELICEFNNYFFVLSSQNFNPFIKENVFFTENTSYDNILSSSMDLYINHGGVSSIMCAIKHETPTLTLPFIGDQPYNSEWVSYKEIGSTLDKKCYELYNGEKWVINQKNINKNDISKSIHEILNNNTYRERLKLMNNRIKKMKIISDAIDLILNF